jgi:ribonuclease Z
MPFQLTLLGTSSALPAHGRFSTAQLLQVSNHRYLIDCGEGTQIRLMEYGLNKGNINRIFISHLHGDHYYGLLGLLTSYSLLGRTQPLTILGPEGLEAIFEVNMRYSGGRGLSFPIRFQVIDPAVHQCIFEDEKVKVYSLPLDHRIPAAGFLFREKPRPRNMIPDKIEEYQIPYQQIPAIKDGADFTLPDGSVIPNVELTLPPPAPRSFAYCSDTAYREELIPLIEGVDLLYHESTFLQENLEQAILTKHSTAKQAATIAAKAGVERLVLGHYSSRYKDLTPFLEEARKVFPKTELGVDGHTFEVAEKERSED